MRVPLGCLSVVMILAGCGTTGLPTAPSSTPFMSVPSGSMLHFETLPGNWSPWFYPQWQPGIGQPLAIGESVSTVVDADDICAPHLRAVWDARSSCKRFNVSVPADGWLDTSLRWDASAAGFDERLAGEFVLVAPDGRMASTDWQHVEQQLSAHVQPGDYGVLVMIYVPVSLPFRIELELRQ